jgi:hypothetical protein
MRLLEREDVLAALDEYAGRREAARARLRRGRGGQVRAASPPPPQLFRNAPFDLTAAPNRYGLAAFYSQHVWLWKANPAGVLAMWNPRVVCPR